MPEVLKKLNFRKIFWIFFYFFVFGLLLRNSFNYLDPDLGWHLKVGQEIIQTGQIPHLNHYNYTFIGSWVDHEWLSNVYLYFIYSHWGYLALSIFFALLIVVTLILLNVAVRRRYPSIGLIIIAGLEAVGLVAALPHLGVRVQEIAWPFLLLLLLIIDHYERRKNWQTLLFLPPLFYLWSCLHASFLIGLFILAAWVIVAAGERILIKYYHPDWLETSHLGGSELAVFAIGALISAGATLLTPYGLKLYIFLAGYRDSFYQTHIQEWLSQFVFPFQYWQLFYLALVVLAFFLYAYHALAKEKLFKIKLWTVFLLAVFIYLAFRSRRNFPLLFVASFIFMAGVYFTIGQEWAGRWTYSWDLGKRWLGFCLILCLFLIGGSQLAVTRFTGDPFVSFCQDYPCGATTFLESHPAYDSWRLFDNYEWGGFLIWTFPRRLLFIDGRLPQVAFDGHSFLAEYLDFFKSGAASAKLSKYNIRLVMMPAKDRPLAAAPWEKFLFHITASELAVHNYLRAYLDNSPDWQIIYSDPTAVIYARKF